MSMIEGLPAAAAAGASPQPGRAWSDLGQADFFRLLTVQIKQQDPFDPVDNKQMLAQMAQFTSLAGISQVNDTLQQISARLDALVARGEGGAARPVSPADPAPANPNPGLAGFSTEE